MATLSNEILTPHEFHVHPEGANKKICVTSIYKGMDSGDIPSIRIGRRRFIPLVAWKKKLGEVGNDQTNKSG